MKDFTHAVVRTVGEDGTSRSMLIDAETARSLTHAEVTQIVSAPPGELPDEIRAVLSVDLGGVKRAISDAERRGLLHGASTLEEIEAYLDEYQLKNRIDFGLPRRA